jgi:hypothetical protein
MRIDILTVLPQLLKRPFSINAMSVQLEKKVIAEATHLKMMMTVMKSTRMKTLTTKRRKTEIIKMRRSSEQISESHWLPQNPDLPDLQVQNFILKSFFNFSNMFIL